MSAPTPAQEAQAEPFRFLTVRGWRPLPQGNGWWRHTDGRELTARAAIDHELATPQLQEA